MILEINMALLMEKLSNGMDQGEQKVWMVGMTLPLPIGPSVPVSNHMDYGYVNQVIPLLRTKNTSPGPTITFWGVVKDGMRGYF